MRGSYFVFSRKVRIFAAQNTAEINEEDISTDTNVVCSEEIIPESPDEIIPERSSGIVPETSNDTINVDVGKKGSKHSAKRNSSILIPIMGGAILVIASLFFFKRNSNKKK